KRRPIVNASVDGNDVIYHGYQDISVAVSTDKGLVTPVLRDAQDMGFADIEKAIANFARKAREGGLTLDDLQGGTFTITNGGTSARYSPRPSSTRRRAPSSACTPSRSAPSSRTARSSPQPMMYVAISYDHRIIDGKARCCFWSTSRISWRTRSAC
ncbi:Dihydrolipoamide succinyltransferase, partial [mine drainage metagenome]